MTTMILALATYDWQKAFEYAGETGEFGSDGSPDIRGVPGSTSDLSPFTRTDVVELLGSREGENDGPSWKCAGRLRDGRWFYLEAGCDYTGWD